MVFMLEFTVCGQIYCSSIYGKCFTLQILFIYIKNIFFKWFLWILTKVKQHWIWNTGLNSLLKEQVFLKIQKITTIRNELIPHTISHVNNALLLQVSGKLPPRKIVPRLGLGFVWVRVRVRFRVGGGRGAIFLWGNCPRVTITLSDGVVIFEHW